MILNSKKILPVVRRAGTKRNERERERERQREWERVRESVREKRDKNIE